MVLKSVFYWRNPVRQSSGEFVVRHKRCWYIPKTNLEGNSNFSHNAQLGITVLSGRLIIYQYGNVFKVNYKDTRLTSMDF